MCAARAKGTVGNGKFKLSLTPAFRVNVRKCHNMSAIKQVDHIPGYLLELSRCTFVFQQSFLKQLYGATRLQYKLYTEYVTNNFIWKWRGGVQVSRFSRGVCFPNFLQIQGHILS